MGRKMNVAKTNVMVVDNTQNQHEQCVDRKCWRIRILGTALQPRGSEPGKRDTTGNHGRLGAIRQTTTSLQKQPCHLLEETCVQMLRAANLDSWFRDLNSHQTRTEHNGYCTFQNGTKYAQYHLRGQILKDQHLAMREDTSHRLIRQCGKTAVVLGRAHQPPRRRPRDLSCHQLETIRQ